MGRFIKILLTCIVLLVGCRGGANDSSAYRLHYVDTVADLVQGNLSVGDVVKTFGFYEPDDKGDATYRIVKDQELEVDDAFVHELHNGKKAKLIIENDTVKIRQLGARADYAIPGGDTDNYSFFMAAFASDVPIVDLQGGTYFIGDKKRLLVDREIEIKGGHATLISDAGILFDVDIDERAQVSDFDITPDQEGMPRKGIGIEIVNNAMQPDWGGSVDFYNVKSFGYQIGVKGDMLYNTTFDRVHSSYNDIGFLFESSAIFSNMNEMNAISAIHNTYGIVMEDFRNAVFDNSVIESNDYGVVVDETSELVDFRNTWFELIKVAPVVFGEITGDNNVLKTSGLTNNKVYFYNNRWSQVERGANVFYSSDTLFTSRYKQVDGSTTDFGAFMDSGIVYKNYAEDAFHVDFQQGGNVSYVQDTTPFGEKRVTRIVGADSDDLFVGFPFTTLEPGNVYLVKFKVRLNQTAIIRVGIPSSPNVEVAKSDDTRVNANAWTEVSAIVELIDDFSEPEIIFDGDGRIGFSVYESKDGLILEAIEPAVYDLTEIFGRGNEPDVYLNNEISSSFKYVDYLQTGKTGD